MYRYSPTTQGFYLDSIHADIPADAVILTNSEYEKALSAKNRGEQVSVANGKLVFIARAVASEELLYRIDAAADAARARVAGDPLRAVEYDRARIEAQAFADAGYPADAVPRTVAAWAINGRTAQQAANSILAEAAAYTEALYVIRETRLAAKEQIRTLMAAGEVEQAQQVVEHTVAAIEAAVAGVGNAA